MAEDGAQRDACKKKERDRGRTRNKTRAEDQGREYVASNNRLYDRDDLLEEIILWHKRQRLEQRIEAP